MPLHWAIIGCGDIANKRVAPAMVEDESSDLVAFFSNTRSRAEEMRDRFGARKAYSSLDALLADSKIDAVYIASPPARHCNETVRAAAAGKHVLCEKPMALTVEECKRMVQACADAGVALGVAYYRRWYPKARKVKELLDAGAIGTPVSARVFIGSRYDPSPGDWKHWRVEAQAGGGSMMDVGSHRLDLLAYWLGEPERVAGMADNLCMSYDVPDMETLICRMKSGCQVVAGASFALGTSFDEMEIHGTEGSIIASPFDSQRLVLRRGGTDEVLDLPPQTHNVHLPLVASFAERVSQGLAPEFNGVDGMQATRIIHAGYRSAKSGKWEDA
ncbi:MAG: Gfo/Idh/MocA family oxidoreductase [Armatimonadetes bacterium]|nr:Gfo/Idh/MocA family oxidoreductase [Armatimonadota bacterium]